MNRDVSLIYRMRTCAAALAANVGNANTPFQRMHNDAADLLIEASNELDVPEELEPMPVISNANAPVETRRLSSTRMLLMTDTPIASWGDELKAEARPCPNCGSVDARTVHRSHKSLMLTCPRCSASWEYGK